MNVFLIHRFYEDLAFLEGEEAFHCYKVMRKKAGEQISLIDGKGTFYKGTILENTKNSCKIQVSDKWLEEDKGYYLHLAVAPTKNMSRFEWFVEKAIEIGIDEITPFTSHHSERSKINLPRLNKICLAATKQSLSATIPVINPMRSFDDLLDPENCNYKVCAHLDQDSKHLKNIVTPNSDYIIMIGPEGDFSKEEINRLKTNKWLFGTLGNKRLRTETAAVVATQIINTIHF
jgi:16S rRNA (uracil1498-N3)-methyltransferase